MQPTPGAQVALHLDLAYVGAHHLARFLVVTFASPSRRGVIAEKGQDAPDRDGL
jgi:uncharacterized membrane protein AbrB (regulator of aidB expression)